MSRGPLASKLVGPNLPKNSEVTSNESDPRLELKKEL